MKLVGRMLVIVLAAALVFAAFASEKFARNSTAGAHLLAADTAATYARQCSACHGGDGRGRTRRGRQTHARDLTDGGWQDDVSDERLFNSINNGRGKMPPFKKKLSESEIDALVAHVRRLRR